MLYSVKHWWTTARSFSRASARPISKYAMVVYSCRLMWKYLERSSSKGKHASRFFFPLLPPVFFLSSSMPNYLSIYTFLLVLWLWLPWYSSINWIPEKQEKFCQLRTIAQHSSYSKWACGRAKVVWCTIERQLQHVPIVFPRLEVNCCLKPSERKVER